jgi:hypothetical protein
MEGAAGGSYLLPGWRVFIWCAAVVCRITSKRAKVDWRPAHSLRARRAGTAWSILLVAVRGGNAS